MVRRFAALLALLLLPASMPALECMASPDVGAGAILARDATRVDVVAPELWRAILEDESATPELHTTGNAGESSARQGDAVTPTKHAALTEWRRRAQCCRRLHRDALALRFREHLCYDATAPPLG